MSLSSFIPSIPLNSSLTESYGLWRNSEYGKNVIIGVVDSGVWPEHPSFNDRGMTRDIPDKWRSSCQHGQEFNSSHCNLKIIGAKYFYDGLKRITLPRSTWSLLGTLGDMGHCFLNSCRELCTWSIVFRVC